MENPPDLIVVVTSDDHVNEKKKIFDENLSRDDLIASLQSDNYALQCEIQQLRAQQEMHMKTTHSNEFNEQSHLIQQRFHDEIQYVIYRHKEVVQQVTNDLTTYLTTILRKSIEDIQSLRLLHQKELSTHTKSIADCIQQQSNEMTELCHHLIDQQQQQSPTNIFNKLLDNLQHALRDLKISFDSKINYLNDIHLTTTEKLITKHQNEINEIQCELNLLSKS